MAMKREDYERGKVPPRVQHEGTKKTRMIQVEWTEVSIIGSSPKAKDYIGVQLKGCGRETDGLNLLHLASAEDADEFIACLIASRNECWPTK